MDPVSASRGIATIAYAPGAATHSDFSKARIGGCVIDSRSRRANGSSNTSSRIRTRSSDPSGSITPAPNRLAISESAGWPSPTTCLAAMSASTTVTPQFSKMEVTALLPEATPPVTATTKPAISARRDPAQICSQQVRTADELDPAGDREVRAEGDLGGAILALHQQPGRADDGADQG